MAPESEAGGGGVSDSPESWGVGGLVGDGRYRLTYRLGRGGMAEVFAAEDVRLGRTVAVKLLRSDLAEDPVSKARFTREAQSVAGLNHHAVVAVYDSGEDYWGGNTVPYIVMELVEGRTIRDLLMNAEAPPPEQALIIVSGVLEALAYSHQHGIVHRDIKPANVIITDAGAVKVMDFGIARALHGAASTMTQTGMVMGTPQYLSPEQALGKAVDHRSDLYATGCLLYELLALRPPFTGETPLSVVYQHVQDMPVPPSQVAGAVPPELDGLVMRSLAKDPDDRFQSAEEMRALVAYSLQMLQQQGGHTGTWNTGPVAMHEGSHTPAMGTAATTALGHPQHGDTSQGPILPPMNPDDGSYDGDGNGRGGRGWLWVVAALAVIAVVAGVVFAMGGWGINGTGGSTTDKSPSPTQSDTKKPSDTPTDDSSPDTSAPGTSSGGQYPDRPSYTPSNTPSESDPGEPSSPPPSTSGGSSSSGSSSTGGKQNGGNQNGGSGSEGSTSSGSQSGGNQDGGATSTGSTTDGSTTDGTTSGTGTTTTGAGGDPAGGGTAAPGN
ncbi:protein kinase [Streptomyces sp. NBC_01267]|uniref:protein kinase domain-containing protein n=1 Tax=unclassified Streptomyces TaxID=2593676 RepID=UPI0020242D37|nr:MULTISPECIES: protein kinase [unclassified Streptomyces]WSC21225.1 protein kinase [Streptomyces sp. NBC_01766]WSV55161.1 protein kinase [Streptomyces sp. NBC_01014]